MNIPAKFEVRSLPVPEIGLIAGLENGSEKNLGFLGFFKKT